MVQSVFDSGCLIAAMDHAIGAFFVISGAIGVPIGLLHQRLKTGGIPFAEQIAGPLPAKDCARRVAPRRAGIGSIAGKKVKEKSRLEERPGLGPAAARKNLPEQCLGFCAIQEMLLVGGAFIGISWRH